MDAKDVKYMNEDFEEAVKSSKENFDDWQERFGKNTYGSHELMDRVYVLYENWETYVLSHPTTSLDKSLYEKAWKINKAMADFYQEVGRWDCPEEEKK
ncbi:hypothetical protein C4577_02075 [Candidatus Parcubacteria bacterium]|nr:MAG: hypothetical protein C4577_02075 [Candidatus Parcubacteria bacterium]